MDANLLLKCFAETLQADVTSRTAAEKQLKEISVQPGFLGACLDILETQETPAHVKKAAAVYFKNRVVRYWASKDTNLRVDEGEKPVVKDRIVPVLLVVDHSTRQQILPAFRLLVSLEFDNWSKLLEQTGQLLQELEKSEDYLYTAILCLVEITRKFKWADNQSRSNKLDPILEQTFPFLLSIGKSLLSQHENGVELTETKAEILKLILKSYRFVTYYEIPNMLRERDQLLQWGEFHASVISMKPPAYAANTDVSEQEKSLLQVAKCYKWSVANILRLFIRYGSQNSLSRKIAYPEFLNVFINEFMPHFFNHILKVVEEFCQGVRWIGLTELYQLLEFLSHCISEMPTWKLIKPHFEILMHHFIYPVICPSDHLLETFEDDPQEYINLCFDTCGDYDNERYAALGFVTTSLLKHAKFCLPPITSMIQQELTNVQNDDSLESAKKKDGLMRILGSISGYLVDDDSIAPLLTTLVVPNFKTTHEFLKARTIEVCSQFADVQFAPDVLAVITHGILNNFDGDVSLPVRFNSALSIQAFITNEDFKNALSQTILPVMSKLLELSNEIDNDAISIIMQECVESFSEQLQPFGVDLMSKLVHQFLKLAIEINEASKVEVDDFDANYEDQGDKAMAALGFLNTMITVLLSFENSHEICVKLEEICAPAIDYVLVNQMDDFFAEIGELIENATFLLRAITPIMWKNFKLLYDIFEQGSGLLYVEELLPCLTNYMIYGKSTIKNDENLQKHFFQLLNVIAASSQEEEVGSISDLVLTYEFAENFILTLEENAAPYVPQILEVVLSNYHQCEERKLNGTFTVNSNNVIIACLVYSTEATIAILKQTNQFSTFFKKWLDSSLERVFDLKLSLLGLMKLISINQLDSDISLAVSGKIPSTLKQLVTSITNLEKKRKNIDDFKDDVNLNLDQAQLLVQTQNSIQNNSLGADDEQQQGESGYEEDWEDDVEATKKYIEFLNNEESQLTGSGFQDEEEIYEDPLAPTPLDEVNIFELFKSFLHEFQLADPDKFNVLFGNLKDEDQKVIIDVVNT